MFFFTFFDRRWSKQTNSLTITNVSFEAFTFPLHFYPDVESTAKLILKRRFVFYTEFLYSKRRRRRGCHLQWFRAGLSLKLIYDRDNVDNNNNTTTEIGTSVVVVVTHSKRAMEGTRNSKNQTHIWDEGKERERDSTSANNPPPLDVPEKGWVGWGLYIRGKEMEEKPAKCARWMCKREPFVSLSLTLTLLISPSFFSCFAFILIFLLSLTHTHSISFSLSISPNAFHLSLSFFLYFTFAFSLFRYLNLHIVLLSFNSPSPSFSFITLSFASQTQTHLNPCSYTHSYSSLSHPHPLTHTITICFSVSERVVLKSKVCDEMISLDGEIVRSW